MHFFAIIIIVWKLAL